MEFWKLPNAHGTCGMDVWSTTSRGMLECKLSRIDAQAASAFPRHMRALC